MPSPEAGAVLVVDDEESLRELLSVMLTKEGYSIQTAASAEDALLTFQRGRYDVVLSDVRMPGMDGITLLGRLREADPDILVIVMTAFSTWQRAVEAMRLGAFDYVRKPFDNRDVKATIARAIRSRRLKEQYPNRDRDDIGPIGTIIGSSKPLRDALDLVRRVAPTDSTVLVTGESGTGKELVARALHFTSLRASAPFIAVNCGAFTETLLESELFGHVRGSFTGAVGDKKGLLEVADGGTFFLDEVSEMTPTTQVKFLRVLEEREFKAVGSTDTKSVDVRFVMATNRDLEAAVKEGAFREDLFYRINVIAIHLPPLRERREDIPLLAGHFLAKYVRELRKGVSAFSTEAIDALMAHDWPGNVRELENVVQRAVALSEHREIGMDDLAVKFGGRRPAGAVAVEGIGEGFDLEHRIEEVETAYIQEALARSNGRLTAAAKILGVSFRSLRYKVKKYGITKVKDDAEAEE